MFAAVFALGACGGDAESAWDEDDRERTAAEAEAEAEPAEEAAAEPEAPAAAPAPRTQPSQGEPQRNARPPLVQRTDPTPSRETVPPVREEPGIPAGTTVRLTLESTLSTQNSQVGDHFYATVAEEVIGSDGMVLIPEGARVRGQVVESRRSGSADEEAVLAVDLQTLLLQERELPLRATVTETTIETDAADSGTRTATKVATGAAAGAVVGQILGRNTRSTLQGAAAGAVAGTAVALATRDGNAVLREGSTIVIRLDERVPLVASR